MFLSSVTAPGLHLQINEYNAFWKTLTLMTLNIICQYHKGIRHALSDLLCHLHVGGGGHVWDGEWRECLLGQQTLGEKEEFDRRQEMGKRSMNQVGQIIGVTFLNLS